MLTRLNYSCVGNKFLLLSTSENNKRKFKFSELRSSCSSWTFTTFTTEFVSDKKFAYGSKSATHKDRKDQEQLYGYRAIVLLISKIADHSRNKARQFWQIFLPSQMWQCFKKQVILYPFMTPQNCSFGKNSCFRG